MGFSVTIVKEKGHMSVCYREQLNLCFDQMFVKYLRTSQLLMIIIIFGCQSDIDTVIFVSTKKFISQLTIVLLSGAKPLSVKSRKKNCNA